MFAMMWNSSNTRPKEKRGSTGTFWELVSLQFILKKCYCPLLQYRLSSLTLSHSFSLTPITFFIGFSTAQCSWDIRHLEDKLSWEEYFRRKNTIIKAIYSFRQDCLTCRIMLCHYLLDRYVLCFTISVSTIMVFFFIDTNSNIVPQLCLKLHLFHQVVALYLRTHTYM